MVTQIALETSGVNVLARQDTMHLVKTPTQRARDHFKKDDEYINGVPGICVLSFFCCERLNEVVFCSLSCPFNPTSLPFLRMLLAPTCANCTILLAKLGHFANILPYVLSCGIVACTPICQCSFPPALCVSFTITKMAHSHSIPYISMLA